MISKMCDCNQGRLPCSCKPVAQDNSEARQAFFGCVYRNAQSSPAEISRYFSHQVRDQKELTTEVVKLMDAAFTVAMAESQDLRMQISALEDEVRGLQELMKGAKPAATIVQPAPYPCSFSGFRVVRSVILPDDMMMVGDKVFKMLSGSVNDGQARDV